MGPSTGAVRNNVELQCFACVAPRDRSLIYFERGGSKIASIENTLSNRNLPATVLVIKRGRRSDLQIPATSMYLHYWPAIGQSAALRRKQFPRPVPVADRCRQPSLALFLGHVFFFLFTPPCRYT